jgi:uncharacterized FlaG/YvyC family protein
MDGLWSFQEETEMSSYVAPLGSGSPPQAPSTVTSATGPSTTGTTQTTSAQSPSAQAAVAVSTVPASPPPDVTQAMNKAAQVYQELKSQQKELQFVRDPRTGRIVAEIRDSSGNVVARVPSSKVLDLASGSATDD